MESLVQMMVLIIVLLSCLIIVWISIAPKPILSWINKRKRGPPQPDGAWPLIGHLHLLIGNKIIHETLSVMADKYGPIFSLRLGFHETLVISNWQIAKECFTTTNDKTFSTRPKTLATKLMAYNHSVVGVAPYGQYWRSVRKFTVIHLLSNQRLQMLKHVRFSEIDLFTKNLYRLWDENGGNEMILVNMSEKFTEMVTNIITRMVAGKKCYASGVNTQESKRLSEALSEFSNLLGLFMISDAIPLLGGLDILNGNCAKMKRVAKEIDNVFTRWVNEHKEKRLLGRIPEQEMDFIHVMLSHLQDGELANIGHDDVDDDTIIKSTCMSLILGGNDPTPITMTWVLSFILNNRDVLQKAQEELDTHVGRHRLVEESDIENLVYLQAIFKETMRLQPTNPLLVPREAMEDCNIAGFDIPAGTRLYVNAWKMHRDPSVWSDPLEFKPERFLMQNKNINVTGQNFELLPFGCGRRVCPGTTFSQQIMYLGLARLLQLFELDTQGSLQIDMTQSPGISVRKTTSLEVLLCPRLSYDIMNDSIHEFN